MEKLLDKIIKEYDLQKTLVIGIDGLGGTGKTTIANSLKLELSNKNYNSIILHIDDFIHPRNIRYNEAKEEWYCYYNIQWRYDYLIKEILMPIKEGIELDKQIEIYDKDNDIYILEQINIPQGSILLLEGIFLQRKEIREYFDYIIYLDTPKEVRLNRVINRDKYIGNWEDIKLKYERRYFPAENKYVEEYCPMANADLVLNYVRNRGDNKMIIREATLSDACTIAKVHVDTWRTTYKGIVNDEFLNELSYDKREEMWINFINNSIINNKHIFVVEDDENGIVGFASYGMERENGNLSHGELYAIYILEKYQNKGIGRLLFNCVIKRLDELKFKSLLIWALEDNYQACKFYELLGGKKVKEKYIEIGKDRFKEIAYSWLI